MSNLPYKNPISPIQEYGTPSVRNTDLFGTHFSIYGVGGYMEVYNVLDLYYTIPSNTYGLIQYSSNTIPISFSKGSGTTFSIDTLTLNSDLISSGRRRLGMIVYVHETDQTYQFLINNYDNLWSAATASTGTVITNQYGTIVRANSSANQNFINAWIGNTVEGLSGTSRQDAVWKKYYRTQQFINNLSTGLFYFTGITITSLTTFSVSPVKGWIVDNETDVMNPTITYVEYSGQTGLTTPYLSSSTITFVLLTSGGTILTSSTAPTTQQQRQNIYLGKLGHANRTSLIQAFNEPDYVQSPLSQLRDMFFPIRLINTGVYPSSNGANLQFNTSSGNLYGLGINYIGNIYTPNELIVSGQSPVTFQYRTQTGGTTGNITLIDPTNYDNGGVITLVGGGTNRSTNQRIFLTQTGTIRVQYGQQIYSDLPSAIAAANTENFITFTNFRDNAILIGILSVRHTATDLSDTTQARFLLASKFGETIGSSGGISTTTLQQAYNNSSTPEIVTNNTEGPLSIKNGTGNPDSSTLLLEGQNAVGTTTSFLRADGMISGSTFSTQGFIANTNGITATTVSATTYYNLPSSIFTGGTVTGPTDFTNGLTANTISATTYYNLPGSSSSNCFTTFYTTNISGCSPVNILSLLNVTDGLSVTGTSTFTSGLSASTFSAGTYQNLPSFNSVQINGNTQFSGDTNNFINFSGTNISITSASTNTLVLSGNSGTVTSVTLAAGTTGTDVNISNPTITTSGTITLNIPDASTTARGLITTGTQTIAGSKTINGNLTITGNTTISGLTASQIVATDANDTLVSLDTATYPSLTELSYVKGITASTQTQLNNKTDYFTIVCNAGGTNLADATTYYMGQGGYAVSTTVNTRNVYVPFTSTLTNATIVTGSAVVATTENTTVIFRLNNTTDTTLSSTIKFSGGNAQSNGATLAYNITGLSIAVSAGDFFEIKFTTPTWVTNPTSASLTIHLYFRR